MEEDPWRVRDFVRRGMLLPRRSPDISRPVSPDLSINADSEIQSEHEEAEEEESDEDEEIELETLIDAAFLLHGEAERVVRGIRKRFASTDRSFARAESYLENEKAKHQLMLNYYCCICEKKLATAVEECSTCGLSNRGTRISARFTVVTVSFTEQLHEIVKDNMEKLLSIHEHMHRIKRGEVENELQLLAYCSDSLDHCETFEEFRHKKMTISCSISADSYQLSNSNRLSVTPVFLTIRDLSMEDRRMRKNIILASLVGGYQKLSPFVSNRMFRPVMEFLSNPTTSIIYKGTRYNINFRIATANCDLEAIRSLYHTRGWHSFHACPSCLVKGRGMPKKFVSNSKTKSRASRGAVMDRMDSRAGRFGYKTLPNGQLPSLLRIVPIYRCPPDELHNFHLGVGAQWLTGLFVPSDMRYCGSAEVEPMKTINFILPKGWGYPRKFWERGKKNGTEWAANICTVLPFAAANRFFARGKVLHNLAALCLSVLYFKLRWRKLTRNDLDDLRHLASIVHKLILKTFGPAMFSLKTHILLSHAATEVAIYGQPTDNTACVYESANRVMKMFRVCNATRGYEKAEVMRFLLRNHLERLVARCTIPSHLEDAVGEEFGSVFKQRQSGGFNTNVIPPSLARFLPTRCFVINSVVSHGNHLNLGRNKYIQLDSGETAELLLIFQDPSVTDPQLLIRTISVSSVIDSLLINVSPTVCDADDLSVMRRLSNDVLSYEDDVLSTPTVVPITAVTNLLAKTTMSGRCSMYTSLYFKYACE